MTGIEKALADYLGEVCGMRLRPHVITGLAQAAIAAMPVQAEPDWWVYECKGSLAFRKKRSNDFPGWTETPLYALPTPPAGGSDAE